MELVENLLQQAEMTNIAEDMDERELEELGADIHEWVEIDEQSRSAWMEKYEEYINLATQISEKKSYPWPNAANVKYPLLSIASLQFAARAYQNLIPTKNVVKGKVVGYDPDGEKLKMAHRVGRFMSYQLLEEIEEWEDEMDRLCILLPMVGNCFKKTYFNGEKIVSEVVLPKDLIVNFYAKSLEQASRKTHVLEYYPNEAREKMMSGEWLSIDLPDAPMVSALSPQATGIYGSNGEQITAEPAYDPDTPHVFLECHCFLDLDNDGYKEPYIVTIHKDTKKVVRIAARYNVESVKYNEDGDLMKIEPTEYFTNFIFVPDPSSGVYGMGFGSLLGPLNDAANTIINQLIDGGTLSNLQSGFIGKGLRMPGGNTALKPGEWRPVQSVGDDIRKSIVPLPVKEPSNVLFSLLGTIIESGNQLSSVTDIMKGVSPGQNQPFSTTAEVLKQGMQVFNSIYKRIHRSLKREFHKLYRLNGLYLPPERYFTILDAEVPEDQMAIIGRMDFNEQDIKVSPVSDPERASDVERASKAEGLFALMQAGTINPQVATKRILEAQDHDNIMELMEMPEPGPSPEQQIEMQKLAIEEQKVQVDQFKAQYQAARDEANSQLALAKAGAEASKQELQMYKMQFDQELAQAKLELDKYKTDLKAQVEKQGNELNAMKDIEKQRMANKVKYKGPAKNGGE